MGPTAWRMYCEGRLKAWVGFAEPVAQPPRARQAERREGPAARWMAPSW